MYAVCESRIIYYMGQTADNRFGNCICIGWAMNYAIRHSTDISGIQDLFFNKGHLYHYNGSWVSILLIHFMWNHSPFCEGYFLRKQVKKYTSAKQGTRPAYMSTQQTYPSYTCDISTCVVIAFTYSQLSPVASPVDNVRHWLSVWGFPC